MALFHSVTFIDFFFSGTTWRKGKDHFTVLKSVSPNMEKAQISQSLAASRRHSQRFL